MPTKASGNGAKPDSISREMIKSFLLTSHASDARSPKGWSALANRTELGNFSGAQFQGTRKLAEILGYKLGEIVFEDYMDQYERGDLAKTIVNYPADTTWRVRPEVTDDSDKQEDTEFEKAWVELEEEFQLFNRMVRVDRLTGIGQFGILVVATNDVKKEEDFQKELKAPEETDEFRKLSYVQPYSEASATIIEWDEEPSSPRHGRPIMYEINTGSRDTLSKSFTSSSVSRRGSTRQPVNFKVHHSRVIHVAEGLAEDDTLGTPRLKAVFDRLFDKNKVVGGGAEMFWLGAMQRLVTTIDKDADFSDDDLDQLADDILDFMHRLKTTLSLEGAEVKALEGQVADPRGPFQVIIDIIAGTTGIPKRVLLGSERGELASSQDKASWFERIEERQVNFAQVMILRPLIDLLIMAGVLPEPDAGKYLVKWESLFALDDEQRANVALTTAKAMTELMKGGDMGLPVPEFREDFLKIDAVSDWAVDEVPLDENDPELGPIDDPLQGDPFFGDTPVDRIEHRHWVAKLREILKV